MHAGPLGVPGFRAALSSSFLPWIECFCCPCSLQQHSLIRHVAFQPEGHNLPGNILCVLHLHLPHWLALLMQLSDQVTRKYLDVPDTIV